MKSINTFFTEVNQLLEFSDIDFMNHGYSPTHKLIKNKKLLFKNQASLYLSLFDNIETLDLVDKVSVKKPKILGENNKHRAVILDCGIKQNSINALLKRDIGVVVLPYKTGYKEILDYDSYLELLFLYYH